MKKFLLGLLVFFLVVLVGEVVYYLQWEKRKQLPAKLSTNEMVVTNNVDVFVNSGEKKVGYFVSGQKFKLTGVKKDSLLEVLDADGYKLWIKEGSSYKPADR